MLISPKIFTKTQSSHVLLRSVDSFEAQNSLIKFKIRFNRISRKILLCDYVTLNPALTLSLFPEGSKEAFHTYFHPGTHFTFILRCISTSWLRGLYSGLYCILYLEGGGTIFICKIILPEVISATWSLSLSLLSLSLELGTRRNYPFSGPWLRPYIIRLGLVAALCRHRH